MTVLDAEKTQRYRKQLLAAVYARYIWIALSIALVQWFNIPFARYISLAGAALAIMNTIALFSFWHLKFDRLMIYLMISSDSLVLLYAIAATGLFTSPFSIVLVVVAAITVLVTDLRYGIFTAAFSATGFCALGTLALTGLLPRELNIPAFNSIFAILQMVVLSTALFSIVAILGLVVSRLQNSEHGFFEQGRVLAEKNHEMSADMAIAATVQQAILSRDAYADDRLAISGRVKPMLEVGGDYFEIFHFATGEIGIFVADVSGHGAGSALITAMLKVSLENAANRDNDTGRILGRINDDMCRIIGQTDFYLTGILCKIHPDTLEFEYCGAAHPEIFLLSNGIIKGLESGGTILGKLPSLSFPVNTEQLKKGDRLLIYTDGITEARHKNGNFWGESRLSEILTGSKDLTAAEFTQSVFATVDAFYADEKPNDDSTLVTIDIQAEARAASDQRSSAELVKNIDRTRAALAEGNLQRVEELLASDLALPLRASISLIRVLRRQKHLEQALSHLAALLAKYPEQPALLEEIGRTHLAAGNMAEARGYFQQAVGKDKTGYSAYYLARMQS